MISGKSDWLYFFDNITVDRVFNKGATGGSLNKFVIWLVPRAGKMKRILCSDWLPIYRFVSAKAKFFGVIFWPYNKSFIDQACSVKVAGYWPRFFFFFFFFWGGGGEGGRGY